MIFTMNEKYEQRIIIWFLTKSSKNNKIREQLNYWSMSGVILKVVGASVTLGYSWI